MLRLSRKSFDRLVENAIAALPDELTGWLNEVPIIVEDYQSKTEREALGEDPLGMYTGSGLVPFIEDGAHLPARIMIYRRPLLELCTTREQLSREIWKTLIHELGHHAGLDEEQLDAMGLGPPADEPGIEWDVDDAEDPR